MILKRKQLFFKQDNCGIAVNNVQLTIDNIASKLLRHYQHF